MVQAYAYSVRERTTFFLDLRSLFGDLSLSLDELDEELEEELDEELPRRSASR